MVSPVRTDYGSTLLQQQIGLVIFKNVVIFKDYPVTDSVSSVPDDPRAS